ncbi:MAG TPA: hypothetical protein DCQ14_00685 [Firmicutes bacterium]|nr:hypothetical protein [Bacillota bacterium]
MRTLLVILMIIMVIALVVIALLNSDVVTVNYLFGQITLNLFTVILWSVLFGVVGMTFFMIYRSIHNYIKTESERALKKELLHRLKTLEDENRQLEGELSMLQREKKLAAEKIRADLEAEKNKLKDELARQQKERDEEVARSLAELELEKNAIEELERLEGELNRQIKEHKHAETGETVLPLEKKGIFDFLKRG